MEIALRHRSIAAPHMHCTLPANLSSMPGGLGVSGRMEERHGERGTRVTRALKKLRT